MNEERYLILALICIAYVVWAMRILGAHRDINDNDKNL